MQYFIHTKVYELERKFFLWDKNAKKSKNETCVFQYALCIYRKSLKGRHPLRGPLREGGVALSRFIYLAIEGKPNS